MVAKSQKGRGLVEGTSVHFQSSNLPRARDSSTALLHEPANGKAIWGHKGPCHPFRKDKALIPIVQFLIYRADIYLFNGTVDSQGL